MAGFYSKKNIVFFCLKIFFTFTNRVDHAAFHLGLHGLQKYLFMDVLNTKGKNVKNIIFYYLLCNEIQKNID